MIIRKSKREIETMSRAGTVVAGTLALLEQHVQAESATNPPSVTPTSTDRMSPSSSRCGPGMPCTTMSFGERQVAAG